MLKHLFLRPEIISRLIFSYSDGKGYYVQATHQQRPRRALPEEIIRQLCVLSLLHDYKYPEDRIRIEWPIQMGREKKRADIVVLDESGAAFIIFEVKVKADQHTLGQLKSYMTITGTRYGAIISASEMECIEMLSPREVFSARDIPLFMDVMSSALSTTHVSPHLNVELDSRNYSRSYAKIDESAPPSRTSQALTWLDGDPARTVAQAAEQFSLTVSGIYNARRVLRRTDRMPHGGEDVDTKPIGMWLREVNAATSDMASQQVVAASVVPSRILQSSEIKKENLEKLSRSRAAAAWISDAPQGTVRTQKEAAELFNISQPVVSYAVRRWSGDSAYDGDPLSQKVSHSAEIDLQQSTVASVVQTVAKPDEPMLSAPSIASDEAALPSTTSLVQVPASESFAATDEGAIQTAIDPEDSQKLLQQLIGLEKFERVSKAHANITFKGSTLRLPIVEIDSYKILRKRFLNEGVALKQDVKQSEWFALFCDLLDSNPIADEVSASMSAIERDVGNRAVEQKIKEAIASGVSGFCGGWISSTAVDTLIKDHRLDRAMPRVKRRAMLQSLGYDWHPALNMGRVNNPIRGYTSKPVLFIKKDHPLRGLLSGAEIVRSYLEAQTPNDGEIVKELESNVTDLVKGNDKDTEERVAVLTDIEINSKEAI